MSRDELAAELHSIAIRHAGGEYSETINESVTALARESGHNYAFLKANIKMRSTEIRERWRREAAAAE